MKQLVHNPLFYLSVVLVLVLGFMVANFVGAFTEPGAAFPGGAPAAPLDTSTQEQTKSGQFNLKRITFIESGLSGLTSGDGICLKNEPGSDLFTCKTRWSEIGAATYWVANGDHIYNTNTGSVAIGTNDPGTYKLRVEGTAFSTGGWEASDARLKKNVEGLTSILNKVLNLTGVYYNWRTEEYPDRGLPEGRHIGFIAQEVEKYFPELVSTDTNGYKALAYDRLTAILLEAVKEQQAQIEALSSRLQALEN